MTTLQITRRANRVLLGAASALSPLAILLVRLMTGGAFFQAGLGKWSNLDGTTAFFESIGLPMPGFHAVVVSTLEVVGGFAVALGLGTRIFSAMLAGTMVVALATADRGSLGRVLAGGASPTDSAPLVLLVMLLVLFTTGSGRIGLDAALTRAPRRDVASR